MTAKEHNKLVGIFLMAHGGLLAFAFVALCVFYSAFGAVFATILAGGKHGEGIAVGVAFIVAIAFIAVVGALIAGPQLIGGYKILKERPNARTWGIVGSIIACMSFPVGTAAGVYGLWFLFGEAGQRFYLDGAGQAAFQPPSQPPAPNSWQ